jgi:WhiB family redox-sensing transcriptional regulator
VSLDAWHKPVRFVEADWMTEAACRGEDSQMFFIERGDDQRPAKEICLRCPVVAECLDYAMRQETLLPGIWGGTSERERRKLRRMMRKPGPNT